jgi:Reverse transcriptase (RNA-dependent DNA polymerase)
LTADGKQRAAEFQSLFSELGHAVDPQDPKYNVLRGRRVRAEFERIVAACSAHASFGGLDDPITAAELIAALKQLPRHKAADACGFRSEHIALILEGYERDALPLLPAVAAWVHAFNHIFDTSEVPQEWCRQVIIALHKGHGKPASKVTSYRAITVTNRILAVMDRIIHNRLAEFAEARGLFGDEQYGWRKKRSTEQAVAVLLWVIEARAMSGPTVAQRRTYCAFLDVASAFDSVCREDLTVKLYQAGIRGKVLAYLRASPLMSYTRSIRSEGVLDDGVWSDSRGVSQGTVGAPFCFSMIASSLISALRINAHGCGIQLRDGTVTYSIHFADDVVCMSETAGGLQRQLDAAHENARDHRLQLSAVKSEVVVFGREGDPFNAADHYFTLGGRTLKVSSCFKYLGVEIPQEVPVDTQDAAGTKWRNGVLTKFRRRLAVVKCAAACPALTALESRQFYFCNAAGVPEYCSGAVVRGVSDVAEDLARQSRAAMLGFSKKRNADIEDIAMRGDLGMWTTDARFAMHCLRMFQRVHAVPANSQLRRVYEHYKLVCASSGDPAGNWCRRVRYALGKVGRVEYFDNGWPVQDEGDVQFAAGGPLLLPREEVARWQQREWRQSILGEGGFAPHKVLNPHYSKIKRHLEIDMYCGEGSRVYRRAMHRLRTEQLCLAVFTGRREPPATRRPRHLRWCIHCPMQEACDVNHFMARCPHRTQERALMEAAVRETMPAAVLAWLGTPWTRPERWVALWLDGEIEGVPFAEAYGRSTRSIRAFHDFEPSRRAYMAIITARTTLRRRLRASIVRLVDVRSKEGGYPRGAR